MVHGENQRLHIELGNLEAQREELNQELVEVRSQLATERVDREEFERELKNAQTTIVSQRGKIHNLERGYGFQETPTEKILRRQLSELQAEFSDLKQNLLAASQDLPEAADLLNQLKAKRKKSIASLADIEAILGMIEKSWGHNQGN